MRTLSLSPVPQVHFAGRHRAYGDVPFHDHPGTEIVLVTAGHCAVEVHGERLRAGPGEAFILPAEVPHNQLDEGDVYTTYANFSAPPRAIRQQARVVPLPLGSPAAVWLEQLADLQRQPGPPGIRSGLALALIEHLADHEQRQDRQRLLHPGLVRALRRIEGDLLEDLTVNDLARTAGLSPSHLTSLFRSHVGCGPLAWQQKQRLELACRLLGNAYLPIAEVAASCGYPDANYFTRLFRQAFGCSPTAWRNRTVAR